MLQEFKTPAGYYLVVDDDDLRCGVFRGEVDNVTPELIRSTGLVVTGVAFLGQDVRPALPTEGLVLLPTRSGSIQVPYFITGEGGHTSDKKGIQLSVKVATDQFPVFVQHFASAREFVQGLDARGKGIFRIVMIGGTVSRIDVMSVRVALPGARVYQTRATVAASESERATVRAADLMDQPGGDAMAKNPVYMARVLLRRLDFPGMERIPVNFDLNTQDLEFIQAFLNVMLHNEHGAEELKRYSGAIEDLIAFYGLVRVVLLRDRQKLEEALAGGMPRGLMLKVLPFVQKQRSRSASREEEIVLWEFEYRLSGKGGPGQG